MEVVQALIAAYPTGAACGDNYACLPLHFAAWYSKTAGVFQTLLDSYPEGASCEDNGGRLPRMEDLCLGMNL